MTARFEFECVRVIFVKNVVFGGLQVYHRTEFTPHLTSLCDRNYTLNIAIESDLNQAPLTTKRAFSCTLSKKACKFNTWSFGAMCIGGCRTTVNTVPTVNKIIMAC
jgi:hypothetical protein